MPRIKLTDKKKKKIIADYVLNENYSETARLNGVSVNTVKNLVLSNQEIANKCKQKKEDNTKDVLEYMDSIAEKQKEVIKLSLDAMISKLQKPDAFTNVKDIATAYGIICDKALKSKEIKTKLTEPDKNARKTIIVDDLPK